MPKYIASRRNPVRFYNSALGIRTDEELRKVMEDLTVHPPRVVAFRPDDKYNTDASARIMELVTNKYVFVETVGGVQLYRQR